MCDKKQIKENIDFLNNRIREYQYKIAKWQGICTHEDAFGMYKANTGNWCKLDDSYWIELKCETCGERFHFDSQDNPEEYRKYSKTKRVFSSEGDLLLALRLFRSKEFE